jgi:hypothetical protein
MHNKSEIFRMVLAASVLAASPIAKAEPDDASLLAAVKQLASQGQTPRTAAQVNQFVDQNQDAINAVLKGYMNYLKQIQTTSANDESGPPPQPQTPPAGAPAANGQNTGAGTASNSSNPTGGGALQSGGLQPSSGLRTSSVRASGGLRTSHLAGYPSLPDVDPTSSLSGLSAAQMQYAAEVQRQMQDRKQYLMQHPEGYTY